MKLRLGLLGIWFLCQVAHTVASFWMLVSILVGSPRAWRIAIAYDRLGNAVTGGQDTETISSRANRARSEKARWGCILCRLLDRVEKDHCKNSDGV